MELHHLTAIWLTTPLIAYKMDAFYLGLLTHYQDTLLTDKHFFEKFLYHEKSIFLCILMNEYDTLLSTHRWVWGFISSKSKRCITIINSNLPPCIFLGFTLIVHRYTNVSKGIINMPNEGGKCLVWQGPGPHVERLQEYWLESGKFHRLHFCYKYLCVYEHKKHLHLMLMVIIRQGQVFFDLQFIKVYLQVLSFVLLYNIGCFPNS